MGRRVRATNSCTCGRSKQVRSLVCRSCATKKAWAASIPTRFRARVLDPVDAPRSPEADLNIGSYITGLWDGEGCFLATITTRANGRQVVAVRAVLTLRDDDAALVQRVAAYFGVGSLVNRASYATLTHPNNRPQMRWTCGRARDIVRYLIPHFDRYPPQGKKRAEYEFWREIAARVAAWNPGTVKTDGSFQSVADLIVKLKALRVYHPRTTG